MIAATTPARLTFAIPLLATAMILSTAQAGGHSQGESIEQARAAFEDGNFPWYDSESDSLKELQFRDRPQWKFWDLSPVLKVAAWTGLVLLAVVLAWLAYLFARSQSARAWAAAGDGPEVSLDTERVEALPFMARRVRGDLLAQARHHYEQGNYAEAIVYLFSYQLVELDKFAVIHLAKGKTNRQYLRETARVTPLKTALERTMLAFEGVFFGRRALDRAGFEACWNGLPEFEQQLRSDS
jgi:hypothetical protein